MDLIDVLRGRIESLPAGDYSVGLRSVLQHVTVAVNHLSRGQGTGEDTAFTDTIYRTNQAFEGSLKEAYRVLARKDPSAVRPYDIESFLQDENLLRPRVLGQLAMYRKEWRNPSAHDYRLDFDEDEALLAIVSVSAFAIVLIDQISEKLNFDSARATAGKPARVNTTIPLVDQIAKILQSFKLERSTTEPRELPRSADLNAAIAGYLSATLPHVVVETNVKIGSENAETLDMVVKGDVELVLVEVKRSSFSFFSRHGMEVTQVLRYMEISNITQAVVFMFRWSTASYKTEALTHERGRIVLLSPTTASGSQAPIATSAWLRK